MTKPISLQLYSVREAMNEDLAGTLAKVAAAGYVGAEPAGIPADTSPAEFAKIIRDLGMVVSAWQGGTPVGDNKNMLLDGAEAMGTTHIVCPYHNREDWQDMDGVKRVADIMSEGAANCAERGMTFGYHNHDFELALVDGVPGLLRLNELVPALYYTVDTYWVAVGGQCPVDIVTKLGDRANLLHIKDGPLDRSEPMVAAGSGKMDFPPIVAAAPSAKWLVVELDRCATDMIEAVEQSARYLIDAGLGHGR